MKKRNKKSILEKGLLALFVCVIIALIVIVIDQNSYIKELERQVSHFQNLTNSLQSQLSNLTDKNNLLKNEINSKETIILNLQNLLSQTSKNLTKIKEEKENLTKILNFSFSIPLVKSNLFVPPAHDETICTYYGCYNFTLNGKYTFTFNLNYSGYLIITSNSNKGLKVVIFQNYTKNIPQNYGYYSKFWDLYIYNVFSVADLNQTTSPVVIPVLPGATEIRIYNGDYSSFYGYITITYVY
jgi:uncharacterized protein YoxC